MELIEGEFCQITLTRLLTGYRVSRGTSAEESFETRTPSSRTPSVGDTDPDPSRPLSNGAEDVSYTGDTRHPRRGPDTPPVYL